MRFFLHFAPELIMMMINAFSSMQILQVETRECKSNKLPNTNYHNLVNKRVFYALDVISDLHGLFLIESYQGFNHKLLKLFTKVKLMVNKTLHCQTLHQNTSKFSTSIPLLFKVILRTHLHNFKIKHGDQLLFSMPKSESLRLSFSSQSIIK